MLKAGDIAPLEIQLYNKHGKEVKLSDFLGQNIVLYFYPKDYTPGCTQQACDFRDNYSLIQKLGAKVIGVSADDKKSHEGFKSKHELNFELLSDTDKKLMNAFGVIKEKKMFGKSFLGIQRSTFILDEKGKIIKVWEKVNVKNHIKEVVEFLEKFAK